MKKQKGETLIIVLGILAAVFSYVNTLHKVGSSGTNDSNHDPDMYKSEEVQRDNDWMKK